MPFEWNGATIACRELNIGDDDDILRLVGELPEGAIMNSGLTFAEFVIGGTVTGEFPVPKVTISSSPREIADAYAAWKKLSRPFMRLWRQEVSSADNPNPKESAPKT